MSLEIEVVTDVSVDGQTLTLDVMASDVDPCAGLLEWEELHAARVLTRLVAGLGKRVEWAKPGMETWSDGEWTMTSIEATATEGGVLRASISLVDLSEQPDRPRG